MSKRRLPARYESERFPSAGTSASCFEQTLELRAAWMQAPLNRPVAGRTHRLSQRHSDGHHGLCQHPTRNTGKASGTQRKAGQQVVHVWRAVIGFYCEKRLTAGAMATLAWPCSVFANMPTRAWAWHPTILGQTGMSAPPVKLKQTPRRVPRALPAVRRSTGKASGTQR